MRAAWKIILSIAFAIVLLQVFILLKKGNVIEFSWFNIASLSSLVVVIYYYIFERKTKKK